MPHQNWPQYSFQRCCSTKNIDTVSHPSPPSIDNEMTPENAKTPLLPPIQLLHSNATYLSWSIIAEVSISTNMTVCPLCSIWDDDKIKKYKDETGEKEARYLWYNNSFSSWHAMRMLSHVLKFQKGGLGACTVIIPKEKYKRYQDFHDQKHEWK